MRDITDSSPTTASAIPAYTGRGTRGTHLARTTGAAQLDTVEVTSGAAFGIESERAQLWVLVKGHGRFVHGEEGTAIAAPSGSMEYFDAGERGLFVAESDSTVLIIEAAEFQFQGPWSQWQDPWRTIVRHQA